MPGFGSIGDPLQIVIRKTDNTILTDVDWDDIVWADVKEIGLKSSANVIGFRKDWGCIIWYPLPLEYDKPLFYVFQKAWGKIGGNWHRFYITHPDVSKTPYQILEEDILPDERKMGYTGTVSYLSNDFDVDIGIYSKPMNLPQSLKTTITTSINLDNSGIEYQFYLNPELAGNASKNVKWVRIYTVIDKENPENNEWTDYDITELMEITNIPDLPTYIFDFFNADKSNYLGTFNFNDIFGDSNDRVVKIEEVTLPNEVTTYCIRIGCSFGPLSIGESINIDPTFGWEGAEDPDAYASPGDNIYVQSATMDDVSNASADSISAYISGANGLKWKCAIYDSSFDILTNGETDEETTTGSGDEWRTFTFSSPKPSLTANVEYWLAIWNDGGDADNRFYTSFDDGPGYKYDQSVEYSDWPASLPTDDWKTESTATTYLIYCTYSESSPVAEPEPIEIVGDTSNVLDNDVYIDTNTLGQTDVRIKTIDY